MPKETAEKKTTAPAHTDHKPGEHKPGDHKLNDHKPHTEHKPKGQKGAGPMPDGCHSWGCKAKSARFDFCNEHYDHFKFGLIKRTGEPVSDYEKKFEHWLAFKRKVDARKSA